MTSSVIDVSSELTINQRASVSVVYFVKCTHLNPRNDGPKPNDGDAT